MARRSLALRTFAAALLIALTCAGSLAIATAAAEDAKPSSPAALLIEARRSFTLDGKPIPPDVFRDFGDSDMGDSITIRVTIDLNAAVGSNLYFGDVTQNNGWVSTKKQLTKNDAPETFSYHYVGATENGLLVFVSAWNGGGSGDFTTLHIADLSLARAYDFDGKVYDRVNLTSLRRVPLGDRWDGEVTIAKNTISVVTTRSGPTDDSGQRQTVKIEAKRP